MIEKQKPQPRVISWNTFRDEVMKGEWLTYKRCFRGQRDQNWGLIAGLHRDDPTPAVFENNVLSAFKSSAVGRAVDSFATNWNENDWWAYGQHHGLRTPLLDWTSSPFVAAFFAAYDHIETQAIRRGVTKGVPEPLAAKIAIWEMRIPSGSLRDIGFEVISGGHYQSARQVAQGGLFTRLRHDTQNDIADVLRADTDGKILRKYVVDIPDLFALIGEFALMNITLASLFPDAEGVARHVNLQTILEPYLRFFLPIKHHSLEPVMIPVAPPYATAASGFRIDCGTPQ